MFPHSRREKEARESLNASAAPPDLSQASAVFPPPDQSPYHSSYGGATPGYQVRGYLVIHFLLFQWFIITE